VERVFKPLLNQSLPKPFNGSRPARERFGDSVVDPIRPVGIRLQENLGTPNFLASSFQLLDNTAKFVAVNRTTYNFCMAHLLVPCRIADSPEFSNPTF
jgi:hypothetical protein